MKRKVPNWLLQARSKWTYTGKQRPDFAEIPKAGQVSVWDFPRPPIVKQIQKTIHVEHEGIVLAKTNKALGTFETASPPTYYISKEDIQMEELVLLPQKTSLCEWKGAAHYWALKDNPDISIAWGYEQPFEPFEALKDHLAFYPQTLDCFVNNERVRPQPGQFYAGWITDDLAGPFKGEPGTGHW